MVECASVKVPGNLLGLSNQTKEPYKCLKKSLHAVLLEDFVKCILFCCKNFTKVYAAWLKNFHKKTHFFVYELESKKEICRLYLLQLNFLEISEDFQAKH